MAISNNKKCIYHSDFADVVAMLENSIPEANIATAKLINSGS